VACTVNEPSLEDVYIERLGPLPNAPLKAAP
jgi:hypothetical protein